VEGATKLVDCDRMGVFGIRGTGFREKRYETPHTAAL
jgi:hypothetical protein